MSNYQHLKMDLAPRSSKTNKEGKLAQSATLLMQFGEVFLEFQ